jgi:outer membrane lipoprotein-sorting protein
MKKSLIFLLAMLLVTINAAVAQSVDEVIEKHFKAIGLDKMESVKSFYIKAKASQMGMEMPMEMKIQKPEKFIITIDVQGQKMVQAFDGEKGWMIIPMMSPEPQELKGEQLEQVKKQVDLQGDFYNYKEKGSKVDLLGKVNVDGKDCYRIKLTTKDENVKDYFIDAETYLVYKVKTKVSAQGQTVDVEQVMSDYTTIDGITMAKKIETKSPMGPSIILMEDIKFNEKYEDAIFKQPAQ